MKGGGRGERGKGRGERGEGRGERGEGRGERGEGRGERGGVVLSNGTTVYYGKIKLESSERRWLR